MQRAEGGFEQPQPGEEEFGQMVPEASIVVPEKKEKPLNFEYIAGPLHVHSRDSEEGRGATHLIPELENYLEDRIDAGTGLVELAVISDHSEHLAWVRSADWYTDHGFNAEEIESIREAQKTMADGSVQQTELPVPLQSILMRAQSAVLEEQIGLIEKINSRPENKVRVFSGTETSIMKSDGTLTLPDSTLAKLDLVTASVHPDFIVGPSGEKERIYTNDPQGLIDFYMKAIDNPNIDVLGHPIKGNMKEIVAGLQKIMETEGSLDRVLAPLMAKMAEKKIAFEINMKDPLIGLRVKEFASSASLRPITVFEEVVRLAKQYGTPLAIGSDFHLFKEWQDTEKIAESLSEDDKKLLETTDAMSDEAKQASEDVRRRFGPGVKFWLRLARICKTLKKFDVGPDQVINSSRENIEKWLEAKKNNPAGAL